MKPTELRIENTVKYKGEKYNVKCISIYSANIVKGPNEYTVPFTELEGIEITEDALFDLGFAKQYDMYNLQIGEINIEVSKSGIGNFWWVILNGCADLKVKYIHQIQNIISALTEDI
jgi:V8-like Glu-specific endopeptidase